MTRRLRLDRDNLGELTADELADVVGALPTNPCPLLTRSSPCDSLLCEQR